MEQNVFSVRVLISSVDSGKSVFVVLVLFCFKKKWFLSLSWNAACTSICFNWIMLKLAIYLNSTATVLGVHWMIWVSPQCSVQGQKS